MTSEPATFPGYRFPAKIISHAVWLYHVFGLSFRDVELLLAERGLTVTHESIRQWCLRFGADFARKLRRRRPKPGDNWHLDKVYRRRQWRGSPREARSDDCAGSGWARGANPQRMMRHRILNRHGF